MGNALPPVEYVRKGQFCRRPSTPAIARAEPDLDLHVIFSTLPRTRAILAAAHRFANGLSAQITILAAQVVPYPLPLEEPPVPVEFTERLLWSLASGQEIATAAEIYLCRDREQTIRQVLPRESVVLMSERKWWQTGEERRLAKILRRDGHRVIFAGASNRP